MPTAPVKDPILSLKNAKGLLAEVDALLKSAIASDSYIAAEKLLGRKQELLSELERHRLRAVERRGAKRGEKEARQLFLESLPSLPLPLLEAAVQEWARRVGVDLDQITQAIKK